MIGIDNRYSFYECGLKEPKIANLDPDKAYELIWDDGQEGKRWLGYFGGSEAENLILLRNRVHDDNMESIFPQTKWQQVLETINKRWGAWSG